MFKVLILQAMHSLSDERCEYLIKDRLSFMRFLGISVADAVPDVLLLLCVALLRRRDDRGSDNLAAHRQETRSPQKLVEAPEQDVDSTGSLQSLTECPDRIGIGNRIRHADAQETHER